MVSADIQHEVSACVAKDHHDNGGAASFWPIGATIGGDALEKIMDQFSTESEISRWIDVPMICVMGDTSSGKSSLLSSLSMIELPSSHKITTRCPILIRMKQSTQQQARVTVQWKSTGPFPNFSERIINQNEWENIPPAISHAQEFILEHTKKDVAPDVVQLDVQGPQCPSSLTLLDLPGLVRSKACDESDTLPQDVQHLVDTYLRNPRSIILAVHAASSDFHNSQIMADAMKVDPQTTRTIPVLTKPDLIDPGAEESVVELLQGEKLSFALGFHMVKGRGQAAREQNQSIQDGINDEQVFFQQTAPWKSLTDRSYFGTALLRQKLVDLQLSMVRSTLPQILKEVRQRRDSAQKKMNAMGELHSTASDRRRYYQDVCQSLVSQLKASLSGKGARAPNGKKQPSAAAALHDACSDFTKSIQEGSLATIRTITEGAQVIVSYPGGHVRGEVVHLDETFACVDYVHTDDMHSEALFESTGTPAVELVEENDVWSDGSNVFIGRKHHVFDTLRKIPLSCIRTDPAWLKEKIAENRTDELACFLNIDIFKSIVEDFIEADWRPQCEQLRAKTEDIVLRAVNDALSHTLPINRYPAFRSLLEKRCLEVAQSLFQSTRKQVESHLNMEKHPYTQDAALFENMAEARHKSLRRELELAMHLDQERVYDTQAIKLIMDGVFERSQRKSVEDHIAEELEIILESYGQIASRRVIDRTPMSCWELVRSLVDSVQDSLWQITDDTLNECMQETTSFFIELKEAQEEFDAMDKALTNLESVAVGSVKLLLS